MNKLKSYFPLPLNITRSGATNLSQNLGYEFLNNEQSNKWDKKLSSKFDKNLANSNSITNDHPKNKNCDTPDSEIEHETTILMIDDEDVCLNSIEVMLIGTPYSVITLSKSTDALEYIYANIDNIDLILLDFNMPGINGLELLEQIKNERMLSRIPIILQSACANDNEIIKAYILGISSFLQKPYKKNQVLNAIKEALDNKTE